MRDMIQKIISGGQTGADRAALDVALKFEIPHGGWVPKGRKTENGPLHETYSLKEMPTPHYRDRTRQNIIDSQATVVFTKGAPKGGSKLTLEIAKANDKPYCFIDLLDVDAFEGAIMLHAFIVDKGITHLNIAGSRASHDPGIYDQVKTILEATFYLLSLDNSFHGDPFTDTPEIENFEKFPESILDAVGLLASDLSLKTKVDMAKQDDSLVLILYYAWMEPIRKRVGLLSGNEALLETCRQRAGHRETFTADDAIMEIIKSLKAYLNREYRLKVLK